MSADLTMIYGVISCPDRVISIHFHVYRAIHIPRTQRQLTVRLRRAYSLGATLAAPLTFSVV